MGKSLHRSSLLLAATFFLFLTTGCSLQIQFVAGIAPDLDQLDTSLRLGESTTSDVVKTLGEPMGKGRALFPVDPQLRTTTMWTYYYEEGNLEDARRIFLFLFFDQDRLGAYMWFSSLSREKLRTRVLKKDA